MESFNLRWKGTLGTGENTQVSPYAPAVLVHDISATSFTRNPKGPGIGNGIVRCAALSLLVLEGLFKRIPEAYRSGEARPRETFSKAYWEPPRGPL